MDSTRIAELLQPFLPGIELPSSLLDQLRLYLDLLLRWNARINLTAVRDPEQIVTRHFGESLFAARVLNKDRGILQAPAISLADIGSGAGFPGIPMKLVLPDCALTLIESQTRKATFLREVVRNLALNNAEVFCGRAEQWGSIADVVTLRAVEQFARAVPIAAGLVADHGKLCLLIGADQLPAARQLTGSEWQWAAPVPVPTSTSRIVALAQRSAGAASPDGTKRNS